MKRRASRGRALLPAEKARLYLPWASHHPGVFRHGARRHRLAQPCFRSGVRAPRPLPGGRGLLESVETE